MQDIETRLREELVPILGLDSVDEVQPDSALVGDIGAESIDFIEIMYMIENTFGVKIKLSEITHRDFNADVDAAHDCLSPELAERLNRDLGPARFAAGMSTAEVFRVFTVHNLARLIEIKVAEQK